VFYLLNIIRSFGCAFTLLAVAWRSLYRLLTLPRHAQALLGISHKQGLYFQYDILGIALSFGIRALAAAGGVAFGAISV